MDAKKTAADVARLAAEHVEMAQYIAMILPFLKSHAEARKCGADRDGEILLVRVRG